LQVVVTKVDGSEPKIISRPMVQTAAHGIFDFEVR
jgi:hypothetical protein